MKKNDRTWERLYAISQTLFSFHASRLVLFFRGLLLIVLGVFGLIQPEFVLICLTRIVGGVLLLFAAASFIMAFKTGRGSVSLLMLFFLLGTIGVCLLIKPLYFDRFLMFAFGVWLILTGAWGVIAAQKRFGQLILPMTGLVTSLIGILLVIVPFRDDRTISLVAAVLMFLSGLQMLLLSVGVDAGKWVFHLEKKEKAV